MIPVIAAVAFTGASIGCGMLAKKAQVFTPTETHLTRLMESHGMPEDPKDVLRALRASVMIVRDTTVDTVGLTVRATESAVRQFQDKFGKK